MSKSVPERYKIGIDVGVTFTDFALMGGKGRPCRSGAGARMTIRRAFADLSVGRAHYAECGDPQATAVFLLHQMPQRFAELVRDFLLHARGAIVAGP
jgi:hypothetical protein